MGNSIYRFKVLNMIILNVIYKENTINLKYIKYFTNKRLTE